MRYEKREWWKSSRSGRRGIGRGKRKAAQREYSWSQVNSQSPLANLGHQPGGGKSANRLVNARVARAFLPAKTIGVPGRFAKTATSSVRSDISQPGTSVPGMRLDLDHAPMRRNDVESPAFAQNAKGWASRPTPRPFNSSVGVECVTAQLIPGKATMVRDIDFIVWSANGVKGNRRFCSRVVPSAYLRGSRSRVIRTSAARFTKYARAGRFSIWSI